MEILWSYIPAMYHDFNEFFITLFFSAPSYTLLVIHYNLECEITDIFSVLYADEWYPAKFMEYKIYISRSSIACKGQIKFLPK